MLCNFSCGRQGSLVYVLEDSRAATIVAAERWSSRAISAPVQSPVLPPCGASGVAAQRRPLLSCCRVCVAAVAAMPRAKEGQPYIYTHGVGIASIFLYYRFLAWHCRVAQPACTFIFLMPVFWRWWVFAIGAHGLSFFICTASLGRLGRAVHDAVEAALGLSNS